MKSESGQSASDLLNSPVAQKFVANATITSGVAAAFNFLPTIFAAVTMLVGVSVSLLVRKKIKKQLQLLDYTLEEQRLKVDRERELAGQGIRLKRHDDDGAGD